MLKLNKVMNDGLAHADMMRYRMGWGGGGGGNCGWLRVLRY